MEKRKPSPSKSSALPLDYLKMVQEVFSTHFEAGLKILAQTAKKPKFKASGAIFAEEVLLSVSVLAEDRMACVTVHASSDFDPTASSPTAETLLAACVDALASLYSELLSPDHPEKIALLADHSLSSLENVPFMWTAMDVNKRKIFLKIDKSNPDLEQMADEWLEKNDPENQARIDAENEEGEEFFDERVNPKKPTRH